MARPRRRDIATVKRLGHVYMGISRKTGMTNTGTTTERALRQKLPSINHSGIPSSAARSRRGSTTYIPVGVDSSLRWNDNGARSGFVVIPTTPLLFPPNA